MAAKRRRRRRRAAASTAPKRRRHRRRRNPGALAAGSTRRRLNPTKRRRRRSAVAKTTRRRRRNPGIASARGAVGGIVQGLKDGGAVVAGQVVTRKLRGAITGMLPADQQAKMKSGVGYIGLCLLSAVVTSLVAKRALPNYSRLISAGAFSETINAALAQSPTAVKFLSAYPGGTRRLNAWPGATALPAGRGNLAAWPVATPGMRVAGV